MENMDFRIKEITRIIERQTAIGWHTENMHYKEEYVMVIILDGETDYSINGQQYHVKKNDFIIFPPKLLRSGRTSAEHPWSFISIIFRMDGNEKALNYFNKSILVWHDINDSIRNRFIEARRAWIGKDPLYQVKCCLLATEVIYRIILSELPQQNTRHIKKLKKARMIIHDNFRQELSVEQLADSIDMSVSYFRRLFHEMYGCSPMQYITNLRIENARDLLLSGEVNVTEAAQLSGFDDIYYFSKLFKAKTGSTPSTLLKNNYSE